MSYRKLIFAAAIPLLLIVALLLSSCTQSHFIFPHEEKHAGQAVLTEKDLHKHIIVTLKDGTSKSGVLLSFTERDITISEKWSGTRLEIPNTAIARMQIEENKYWPLVLAGILIAWAVLFKAIQAYADGIESMGA